MLNKMLSKSASGGITLGEQVRLKDTDQTLKKKPLWAIKHKPLESIIVYCRAHKVIEGFIQTHSDKFYRIFVILIKMLIM